MALYELDGRRPRCSDPDIWIAPSADVIGEVILARGVTVWFNAAIRADNTPIAIGDGSNVQEGAVLHSDPGSPLTVGKNVTVGHRAVLHGCTIEDDVLIGMGAIVMNDAVIGEGSVVGAGALILEGKHFPPRSLIVGSPAVRKNEVDLANTGALKEVASVYVAKGRIYTDQLREISR